MIFAQVMGKLKSGTIQNLWEAFEEEKFLFPEKYRDVKHEALI